MPDKFYQEVEIIHMLRVHLAKAGLTQRKWAGKHKIPEAVVSDFLNGRRGPSDDILEALGLDPQPGWRMAMSRKRNPVPTPAHIDPAKVTNRKQIAELRIARKAAKPK